MTMPVVVEREAVITLQLRPVVELSDDAFLALCALNGDLRLERTAMGEIVIMPPAGGATSNRNLTVAGALSAWAVRDGSGFGFDASGGFKLPNGAIRGPDAAWVRRERLAGLSAAEKEKFLPLCPDFVVELRSPSDRLSDAAAKMDEYVANGARLGWLIDPLDRTVYVYRPGRPVEPLREPASVSGDPELPGFTLALEGIWRPLA